MMIDTEVECRGGPDLEISGHCKVALINRLFSGGGLGMAYFS